jgi:hypothetical protein
MRFSGKKRKETYNHIIIINIIYILKGEYYENPNVIYCNQPGCPAGSLCACIWIQLCTSTRHLCTINLGSNQPTCDLSAGREWK